MENIILVDINDNEIGHMEKLKAHKKPILHRAFSVFIINKNKMLIQKRALKKYHSGGLWANACCSHQRYNISFEQSVKDRLYFELGLKNLKCKEIFSFIYMSKFQNGYYEYEYDHVLIASCNTKQINFNLDEICKTKWISIKKLKQKLQKNPTKFAPWFLISAPKVINYIESKKA